MDIKESKESYVNKAICSIILDAVNVDELDVIKTIKSLLIQTLQSNEYLQLFLIGYNSNQVKNLYNKIIEENICNLDLFSGDSFDDDLIKSDWICFGRSGNLYSVGYFSGIYHYIDNNDAIYIGKYLTEDNKRILDDFYYGDAENTTIDKLPYSISLYFDSAWLPRDCFYMGELEDGNILNSFIRIFLNALIKKRKVNIVGKAVLESVFRTSKIKIEIVPTMSQLQEVYLRTINYSISQKGYVDNCIQYLLIDLYKTYISNRHNITNLLQETDEKKYYRLAIYCLSYIEFKNLKHDKRLSLEQKLFILRKNDVRYNKFYFKNDVLFIGEDQLKIEYFPLVEYQFAEIKANKLKLEGCIFLPFITDITKYKIYFHYGELTYQANILGNYQPETLFADENIAEKIFFESEIPLEKSDEISCWISLGEGITIECTRYRYARFFPVSLKNNQYFHSQNWILRGKHAKLELQEVTTEDIVERELAFCTTINSDAKYLRDFYKFYKKKNKKKIWLIWDRPNAAGDNGEALFCYLMENGINSEEYYFVLDESSIDFKKLQEKYPQNVLAIGTLEHKKIFVIADVLIGSQTDYQMWPVDEEIFRDIISQKPFVFLQHGITKNDMSANYSRYYQNIRLFITAGISEYENTRIITNYGFKNKMVQLLGFPRFDLLENNEQKYIVILPTWRKYCVEKGYNAQYILKDNFEESEYYTFYMSVINNNKLIETCKQHGYKILLMQHEIMKQSDSFFVHNTAIEIADDSWTYKKVISDAALLITDYSSVSFDFAYLEKALIYCQFDEQRFYNTHTYQEGYFNYTRDGFGPVVYTSIDTVNEIIKYIENNCIMEEKYRSRVMQFFKYRDKNNCLRVSEAIREVVTENE